jgi:hypothetical protein
MSRSRVLNFLSDSKEQLVCEVTIKTLDGNSAIDSDSLWGTVTVDLMTVINSNEQLTQALKRMRQGSIVAMDGNFSACQIELGEIHCYAPNYSQVTYTVTVREAYLNKVNPFLIVANKPGTYKDNQLSSGKPTTRDQPSV